MGFTQYICLFLCFTVVLSDFLTTTTDDFPNESNNETRDDKQCKFLVGPGKECKSDPYPFIQIGTKYYLINTGMKMNWFEAALVCRTYDSDLATIESSDEMDALSFYITKNGHVGKYFWTSGSDLAVEGKFMSLSNGRPMTYTKWSAGQPDNAGDNEDCVHLWAVNNIFHMNDYPCNGEGYPICEMRKSSKCCNIDRCIQNSISQCAIKSLLQTCVQNVDIFSRSSLVN